MNSENHFSTHLMYELLRCNATIAIKKSCNYLQDNHVRDRIRTHGLLVRSQTLYPAELHVLKMHI